MTQEDKDLLLKDLSARLPYGIKCVSGVDDATLIIEGINPNCNGASEVQVTYERSGINFDTKISSIKPYLFPLSSMTEEQEIEYDATFATIVYEDGRRDSAMTYKSFDWYNKNHFDYRGLIQLGLANDATGLNIY
jgi:hypothetical protein